MNHLYRARELSGECMPWVKIRIEPLSKNKKYQILAQVDSIGISKNNEMKISEQISKWNEKTLKHVVFHELGHKYLGARHTDKKCHLMSPMICNIPESKIEKDFIELAKKNKKCRIG